MIVGSFDSNTLLTNFPRHDALVRLAVHDPNVISGLETTLVIAIFSALLSLVVAVSRGAVVAACAAASARGL